MAKRNPRPKAERLIHIRLTEKTHKRLRIRAAELDTSIQQWVVDAIEHTLGPVRPRGGKK